LHIKSFVIAAALSIAVTLSAQTSTGEIDLTIHDSSGAVIPKATVTLTGSETGNVARTLLSNGSGLAQASLLRPDDYDIAVTAPGFEKLLRQKVTLHVGEVLNLNLTLTPGSSSQSVTITGETPALEEKSVTLDQVMESKEMSQLPLNGRNYLDLGRLAPGAVPGPGASQGSRDETFSAYGNTGLQNAFVMDGARNENYLRGLDNRARDALRPPLDALAEFQVQTSNYSAEYGASAGAVISAVTKSGTNQIHGSAYDFLRNDHMDAADFFAQHGVKPLLVQNQFGASAGAPIIKDRIWIFGAYEGINVHSDTASVSTVPTAAQQQGNFGSTPIFDPASNAPNPNGSGTVRTQFPNNIIPASRFNSIGQQILAFYPLPNLPGIVNNYASEDPQTQKTKNFVVRGDVQISSKDTLFVRGSVIRYNTFVTTALPAPAQDPVNRFIPSDGMGIGYTRTFTATLVNELRFSWTRITVGNDETTALNPIINGMLDSRIQHGTPTINVTGIASIGSQPSCCGNSPLDKSSGVWDLSDNLSKSFGKHLLKFGTDVQDIRASTNSALNGRGTLGFTGVFTQNPLSRSNTGSPVADLLLGDANNVTTGTDASVVERGKYAGWYAQDQWTVTPSLTINLGMRYELFFPYVEQYNHMGNFIVNPSDPNFGHFEFAGLNGNSRSLLTLDKNNVAPRVGFAYHLPGVKGLVVRSSYGVFYAQDQGDGVNDRMVSNPPFYGYGGVAITSDQVNPSTGLVLNSSALAPRPAPISAAQFVLSPSSTTGLIAWNQRDTTPYVQEWNFTVEKELPWNMVWQTSYVGNIGIHLWGDSQANQPLTNGPGSPTTRRPLAQYTVAGVTLFAPWDRSTYEGMSTRVEKRFAKGLSLVSSFTYGRSLDLQNPALGVCDSCESGNGIQNAYNRDGQKGPSDQNVPLRFVAAGVWNLPFGPGHALVGHGWGSQVLGDWQISTIYSAQSGLPFTTVLSFDNANAGNTSWPNRICGGSLSDPTVSHWYNTSCFASPASYVFGNEGRNVLNGQGRNNIDFALHRIFPLHFREGMALEFRAEAYNLANHPVFQFPGATIGTASAGVISATALPNRELQMALRLMF
jgi:hypothetical protein